MRFLCKCYIREASLCFTLQSRFENLQNRNRKRHLETTSSFSGFPFFLGIKKPLFFKFRLILNHLGLNWKREGKWWLLRIYSTQIHPRWGPLYQSANPWKTGAVWDRPQQGSVKGHCKGLHKKPGCLPPPGHRGLDSQLVSTSFFSRPSAFLPLGSAAGCVQVRLPGLGNPADREGRVNLHSYPEARGGTVFR